MDVINEIQQMQKELDEIMNMTNEEMYIRLRARNEIIASCIEEEIDEEDDEYWNEYWNDYKEDMVIESKREKLWMN